MRTITNTWGQSLVLAVYGSHVAFRNVARAMAEVAPRSAASSTTLAKLCDASSVSDLNDDERYRAWFVLTALGENLDEWGISDAVLEPHTDADVFRQRFLDTVEADIRNSRKRYTPRDLNPEPTD